MHTAALDAIIAAQGRGWEVELVSHAVTIMRKSLTDYSRPWETLYIHHEDGFQTIHTTEPVVVGGIDPFGMPANVEQLA